MHQRHIRLACTGLVDDNGWDRLHLGTAFWYLGLKLSGEDDFSDAAGAITVYTARTVALFGSREIQRWLAPVQLVRLSSLCLCIELA
jgi:hypothetical protein